jgi:hypothetical protein
MFQTILLSLAEVYGCIRRLFLRKCRLNNYNVLYFSEIKCFQELFETTTYKCHIVISLGDVVQRLGYGLYDRGARVIFFSKQSERLYIPPYLLFNGNRGFFPRRKIGWIVKLFMYSLLVPRLRTRKATTSLPPPYDFTTWCLIQHSAKFICLHLSSWWRLQTEILIHSKVSHSPTDFRMHGTAIKITNAHTHSFFLK